MSATLDSPVKVQTFQPLSGRRKATNAVATVLVSVSVIIALVPLVWVLYTVVSRGLPAVASATWFTNSLSGLLPSSPGGGAYHAIIGTVVQAAVCAVFSIPVGLFVAIYLVEYGAGSRLAKITTFMVDILTGIPSIVAALFVYALWITTLGFARSAFAVSLALVLLMVPVIVRTTEEMLRIVPQDLREAAYALGVPKWKTITKIVVPTALSGIITGIMLALSRIMGETAPLLILALYAPFINTNLFAGPMGSLPGLMVDQLGNPTDAGTNRIWGAALTLILIIAVLNVLAKVLGRFSSVKR